jgi:hypothetical protein
MGGLFVCSLAIAIPGIFGKDSRFKRKGGFLVSQDAERAPLLQEQV